MTSDYDKFKELLDKWGVEYVEERGIGVKEIYLKGIEYVPGFEFSEFTGKFFDWATYPEWVLEESKEQA